MAGDGARVCPGCCGNGELLYDDSISWWFNSTSSSELYGELYYNLILHNPHYWYTYMWETLYGVMGVHSDQVKAVITNTDMPITAIIAADEPGRGTSGAIAVLDVQHGADCQYHVLQHSPQGDLGGDNLNTRSSARNRIR